MLWCFYKILNNWALGYLFSLPTQINSHYTTSRAIPKSDSFSAEQKILVDLFHLMQWKNGTNSIPQYVRPLHMQCFGINDVSHLKLPTRLLGLAKSVNVNLNIIFKIRFKIPCPLEAEDTCHFFMCCKNFSHQRTVLFDNLNAINFENLKMNENDVIQILLSSSKGLTKDLDLSMTISLILFIKGLKDSMNHYFWYRPIQDIVKKMKI